LAQWPTEKWLGVPIAFFLLLGVIGGICDIITDGWTKPLY